MSSFLPSLSLYFLNSVKDDASIILQKSYVLRDANTLFEVRKKVLFTNLGEATATWNNLGSLSNLDFSPYNSHFLEQLL